ncbi:MAG: hypothetical protein ACK48Y_13900, partial [Planctomyces sp.]
MLDNLSESFVEPLITEIGAENFISQRGSHGKTSIDQPGRLHRNPDEVCSKTPHALPAWSLTWFDGGSPPSSENIEANESLAPACGRD